MKNVAAVIAICLAAAGSVATAAETAQQNRMSECNVKAGEKKGDERREFMSQCLSNKPVAEKKGTAQQERMKDCNAKAADRKGDERKEFMSSCLKG